MVIELVIPTLGDTLPAAKADLWCTYAAGRTLAWLGAAASAEHRELTAAAVSSRQNADGGFAWSAGMSSDAWATFYCTQALRDLDYPVPRLDEVAEWVLSTRNADGGHGMMPGQPSDVWATHYAVRTLTETCGREIDAVGELYAWLASLQTETGGLTWSPAHARGNRRADVRACFYGVMAWTAARPLTPSEPWDQRALVSWLHGMQAADGGFRFHDDAGVSCLWATYRATATLRRLGAPIPASTQHFIDASMTSAGPVRWRDYDETDVWAAFSWVGSVLATESKVAASDEAILCAALRAMEVASGGYTYRTSASAPDVLMASSRTLIEGDDRSLVPWIEGCQLPNEGGLMYMPGRGAEVRCTLWGLAAGAFADDADARARVSTWLASVQNPDGGFGYWDGRASDMVSTACAVALSVDYLEGHGVDRAATRHWVLSCKRGNGFARYPDGPLSCRASFQALRTLHALGSEVVADLAVLVKQHQVRSGGFADVGDRVPDLSTTYEAVLTLHRLGVPELCNGIDALLNRLDSEAGVAWSPMAPPTDELMPAALVALLRSSSNLPALALT